MKTIDKIFKRCQWMAIFVLLVLCSACTDDEQPLNVKAEVTDFFPVTGGRNTLLTLKGSRFGTDINKVKVTINGKEAVVKTVADDIITAEVQKGTSSGLVRIILGERPTAQVLIYETEFTYVSNQVVSTYLGRNEMGENDGSFAEATLSKPRYLVWGKDGALYIVEDGGSSENDMACIRMAKDNKLVTLLKAAETPLVQRIRAIDFSSDEKTMFIANDNNANGTMGFGILTKVGGSYGNLSSLWNQGGITNVKVHPHNGAVFIGYHSGSWIYQYDGANFIPKFQLPDNNGKAAGKGNINGITFDKSGTTVYITSRKNHVLYKASYDLATGEFGNVEILAGAFGTTGYSDGNGTSAKFNEPCQCDVDEDGNGYVADRGNHCIRVISPEGEVSTYAGKNKAGMVDGIASQAEFNNPEGCQFGPDGALYVADYSNHLIRKIEETSGQQ